jgi:hypothetical protein
VKRLLPVLLILSMTLFFGCSSDNGTEPEPADKYSRNVLIELFTYHSCQSCPLSEAAIDSLFSLYGDSLVVLEYHKNTTGDTLSPCSTFVNARETMHNVSGTYPTAVFDGVEKNTEASGDIYSSYLNIIQDRFSKKSDIKIASFEANAVDSTSVSYNISIISDKSVTGKLFFVLAEDSVVFEDSVYNFVVRQVYPGNDGMDFSISEDDPFSTSGSIPLNWIPSGEVGLDIFVQNTSTNAVYQGGLINLGTIANPLPPYAFELNVYPDTFQVGYPWDYFIFHFYLENKGSEDDNYDIVATELETVEGWSWKLCAGDTCKLPDSSIIRDTISILSQMVDTFTIEVNSTATVGLEKINLVVTSLCDIMKTDTMNIYAKVDSVTRQLNPLSTPDCKRYCEK